MAVRQIAARELTCRKVYYVVDMSESELTERSASVGIYVDRSRRVARLGAPGIDTFGKPPVLERHHRPGPSSVLVYDQI